MRIFGGERVQNLMDSLGLDEDVPIENKLHHQHHRERPEEAGSLATLPSVNSVLQYDDVMNQQREIIYKQRADGAGRRGHQRQAARDDAPVHRRRLQPTT